MSKTPQARTAEDVPMETYVGDGLFVKRDAYGTVWLRAPRDEGDHYVALEPAVLAEFLKWLADERLLPGQETQR